MRSIVSASACLAALLLLALPARAQDLPAVQLTAPGGESVESSVLNAPGRWLLAYVVPGSAPSDRLVQSLGESWTDERAVRIVFVVSGEPARGKEYLISKGGEKLAATARWFADPRGDAWTAWRFQGTLAVAGMIGGATDWKIDGVIEDPAVLEPAVAAWLR